MAGSLDDLIRFLLDEIALSGQHGNTPADILDFVRHFYKPADGNAASSGQNDLGQNRRSDIPTIDRAFQEQVWKWLTKHPDVHVGRDRKGNKMSLSAVEAQYLTERPVATPEAIMDTSNSSTLLSLNLQQHQTSSNSSRSQSAKGGSALRIYVTEERMWLALCGHSKDLTKVFETEFVLLSIIATHREGGILQGDLVKESGQDKRSVPKRTDILRNKGYIEKRVVHVKGLRTSRLVLRRFASNGASDSITPRPVSLDPHRSVQDGSVDVHVLIRSLFAILKEKEIVTRDDLNKELEMTTQWRARALAKIICKFEAIGCVRRVKAASEASKKVRYYFDCVKLIHEPSDQDMKTFDTSGTSLVVEHAVEELDIENEDEPSEAMGRPTSGAAGNQLEEVDREVPQWNPDRPLTNSLLNVVHEAGTQGFTNRDLRHHVMGIFFRRPLEHLLTRLTARWLQSQPSHLHHLAIVRDTVLSGTIPLYVQYSFPNFEARVASGQAFWEAVNGPTIDSGKKGKRKSTKYTPVSSTGPELDGFGFPASYNPSSQYRGAWATLGQCVVAAQPGDLPFSNRDPILYRDNTGAYVVRYDAAETNVGPANPVRQEASIEASAGPSSRPSNRIKYISQPRQLGAKPIGRPRKFLRGTEKFWQRQFALARTLANADNDGLLDTKAGVMSDPAGLSLFAKRPPQFDPTLVWALENALPVPAKPKDITQKWVDKMFSISSRTAPGIYITPKGIRLQGSTWHKSASRLLVMRSSRLRELDFSRKKKVPAVRFLTSSAAHTYADLRNEFLGEIVYDSDDDRLRPSPSRVQANSRRELDSVANDRPGGSNAPVSHRSGLESDTTSLEQATDKSVPFSEKHSLIAPREQARTTTSEEASLHKAAPTSDSRTSPKALALQATPTRSFGLPPPLTTRSSLRRIHSGSPPRPHASDVHRAPAAAASGKSDDQVGMLLESAASQKAQTTSTHVDNVPSFENADDSRIRSENRPTLMPAFDESSLSNTPNIPTTRPEVPAVHEQAADYLESRLKLSRLPPVEPQTALVRVTTSSERLDISRKYHGGTNALTIDERESEAFRLVQELTANEDEQTHRASEASLNDERQQRVSSSVLAAASGHATLPDMKVSEIYSDHESPRKSSKLEGIGAGSVALLRRKIMLDLMQACGGALPYYQNLLCTAFTTAWQKAGQSGKPDLRTVKAVIKSLCQNGNAKQIKFSHRNKRGIMATKTILAEADMATSDHVILETQKRMIEADPGSYLPEAFPNDPKLYRDIERQTSTPWPAVYDEQTVEPSVTPAKVLRLQLRETLSLARKRRHITGPEVQDVDEGHDPQSGDIVGQARVVGIRRKYTTGSAPYKRPKLSLHHNPQPPQQSCSNQLTETPNVLQFRTEAPQMPLIFEALAPQTRLTAKLSARAPSHSSGDVNSASQVSSIATTPQPDQVRPTAIIWKKIGDQPVLPSSLQDILMEDRRRKKPNYTKEKDPNYREFEWNTEGVARWEQRSFNLFDFNSTDWGFINHLVGNSFQAAPESESSVIFAGLIWYDSRGREHTETRFHVLDQNILDPLVEREHSTLQGLPQKAIRGAQPELLTKQAPRKRKGVAVDPVEAAKKRRRRNTTVPQPQTITDSAGNLIDVSHLIGAKYKRPRGTQHLRTMPKHFIYKLTVTIVVVRALAGGLEKHVDWPLVMCVFPDEDEQFLKDRWKTLSNKHRRDIDQLVENFQDKFPEAYAKGEVPQVNFDAPESVDWESIVEWALNNLDKPVMREIPDLPATRSEFDETVYMKIESSYRPYRDLFGYNAAVSVPIKEVAISAIPFAVPLPLSPPADPAHPAHLLDPTDEISDPALQLAKSWALSTITTPLDTFDPSKAHRKLQSLASTAKESDRLIASAMKFLASARAVAKKRDKGVDPKGRSFDLSRVFTDTLDQRRTINATMLKQAVRYKITVLDPAFSRGEVMRFHPVTIEDGDMVAILNLAANGKIKLKIGDDVPQNRWGVDRESKYETRKINRENLYFTVLIVHVPGEYVLGNPLLAQDVPVPVLGTRDRDRIPIWRDVHSGFQRQFWDLAISAVLGILASRSGASVREVAKTMKPSLGAWEVECLLAWCLEVGAVKKTGEDEAGWTGGWEVREWWWMVLECARLDDVL